MIVARVAWLVLALIVVTHSIFGSLVDFVFLLIRPLVLLALPLLLCLCRCFLSGIIVWAIFVALDCPCCFIEVF
jgi:hypothetical protein